jgi:hypothetical protein
MMDHLERGSNLDLHECNIVILVKEDEMLRFVEDVKVIL